MAGCRGPGGGRLAAAAYAGRATPPVELRPASGARRSPVDGSVPGGGLLHHPGDAHRRPGGAGRRAHRTGRLARRARIPTRWGAPGMHRTDRYRDDRFPPRGSAGGDRRGASDPPVVGRLHRPGRPRQQPRGSRANPLPRSRPRRLPQRRTRRPGGRHGARRGRPGCGGVLCMATHPDHRQQGIATAVLHVGARWAAARGAEELYLHVMDDNQAACRLYDRVGFRLSHTYHYRIKP
ncbi:GNAT family N-acetyltransferase [Streptomyces shenzhenensis]|uniref:N-acetyltransferase domain-containing protein n=1 Tax=Streptomyces shenzhenensis TaxID=943815 RepID=A0A3M0IPR2_9ACTN|nr:GNAT family N-acetyltransferase [Streptomyces shenzhenensis]RMB84066.1 hypothetical protein CTZ28_21430 [Streptomyces shenzhenensis]